jgi:hypothetical protein
MERRTTHLVTFPTCTVTLTLSRPKFPDLYLARALLCTLALSMAP